MNIKHILGLTVLIGALISVGCSDSSSGGGTPATGKDQTKKDQPKPSLPDIDRPSDDAYLNAKQEFVEAAEPFLTYCQVEGDETFEKLENFEDCRLEPYPKSKTQVLGIESSLLPALNTYINTQSETRKGSAEKVFGKYTDDQEIAQVFQRKFRDFLKVQKEKIKFADANYPLLLPEAKKRVAEIEKILTDIGCKKAKDGSAWTCPDYNNEKIKKMTLSEIRRHQNAYHKANETFKELFNLFDNWPLDNLYLEILVEGSSSQRVTQPLISMFRVAVIEKVENETEASLERLREIFGKDKVGGMYIYGYPGARRFADSHSEAISELEIQAIEAHLEKLKKLAQFLMANQKEIKTRAFDILYLGYEDTVEKGRVYKAEDYDRYPQEKALSAVFNLTLSEVQWKRTIQKMDLLEGNQKWIDRQEQYAELEALFAELVVQSEAEELPIRILGIDDLDLYQRLRDIDSMERLYQVKSHPRHLLEAMPSISGDLAGINNLLDARETLIERLKSSPGSGQKLKKTILIYYFVPKSWIPEPSETLQTIQAIDFGDAAIELLK